MLFFSFNWSLHGGSVCVMFAVIYTDFMCFTVHVTSCHCHTYDKHACSMSFCHPSISVCSLTRGAKRRERSAGKFAIEFQRLKCCVWQKHTRNSISLNLSLSDLVNSGFTITNNYRVNLHLLLPKFSLCFTGPSKWLSVWSCLFFHRVRNLLILEHIKVFTGTSRNKNRLRTRQEIRG